MSKVTDVTGHGGKETKVTPPGKQGIQHDRLGKHVRKKMCTCTTGQTTLQARLENRCMVQDAMGTP